jgi:hypothetical protein
MRTRLTPGVILEALREAVTIIEPGEVLAVRVAPRSFGDEEWAAAGEQAHRIGAEHGVTVLLVEGEEFARLKRGEQP